MQHCTGLPHQVTFPAHTEQGKTGPGLGQTFPLIKRKRRMRRRERERKEKIENSQPISGRLRAALLRSFKGCTAKKWSVCGECQGNWDPREGQEPFRPNRNSVRGSTTTLRRQLIAADNGRSILDPAKWCDWDQCALTDNNSQLPVYKKMIQQLQVR